MFQIRLSRIFPTCDAWVAYESAAKYNDIITKLTQGVNTLCQDCGFTTRNIIHGFLRCFTDSQDHVTLRALLTGTNQISDIALLLSYIEDWVQSTQSMTVLHVSMGVDQSCSSVIENLNQTECHTVDSTTTVTTNIPEASTCITSNLPNNSSPIGGVATLGVLWIVTLLALVVVSTVLAILLAIARKDLKNAKRANK